MSSKYPFSEMSTINLRVYIKNTKKIASHSFTCTGVGREKTFNFDLDLGLHYEDLFHVNIRGFVCVYSSMYCPNVQYVCNLYVYAKAEAMFL